VDYPYRLELPITALLLAPLVVLSYAGVTVYYFAFIAFSWLKIEVVAVWANELIVISILQFHQVQDPTLYVIKFNFLSVNVQVLTRLFH